MFANQSIIQGLFTDAAAENASQQFNTQQVKIKIQSSFTNLESTEDSSMLLQLLKLNSTML